MSSNKRESITKSIVSRTFDNGMRVDILPRPASDNVFIIGAVSTGSMHEQEFLGCGLSHFLEHVVFSGTEKYPSNTEIADNVMKAGGYLNASTSTCRTQYFMNLPISSLELGMDMIFQMISAPLFPEDRFIKERDVILRECSMYNDHPSRVLWYKLWDTMYRNHPVRYPIIGFKDRIANVTRDMMNEYYLRRYAPCRTYFTIVGGVDPEKTFEYLNTISKDWNRGRIDEIPLPPEPEQTQMRNETIFFNDPLARILMGWKIPAASHEDYPALSVLMTLMGGLDSSPLNSELKNKTELVIDIDAFAYSMDTNLGVGCISVTANDENVDAIIEKILSTVEIFRTENISERELLRAKADAEADYLRNAKTNMGAGMMILNAAITSGSVAMLDTYLQKVHALTVDDIKRVAYKYFAKEKLSCVVQKPVSAEEKSIKTSEDTNPEKHASLETSSNGLRTLIYTDNSLPLSEIALIFPGGLLYEEGKYSSASGIIAELASCSNAKYDEEEFNAILDDNAIDLNSYATSEGIVFRMNFMSDRIEKAMNLLESMFADMKFDKKIFEREKKSAIDSMRSAMADPRAACSSLFDSTLYGKDHPFGQTPEKMISLLEKLSFDDTVEFCHEVMFNPKHAVFSFSGDITRETALECSKRISNAVSWNCKERLTPAAAPEYPSGVEEAVKILDKEQAVVMYGFPGIPLNAAESDALMLIVRSANAMGSHLFKTVREERGLAYYTFLASAQSLNCGRLAYVAGTSPDSADEVYSLFEAERHRIATEGITSDEFDSARNAVLFTLDETNQDFARLAFSSAYDEFTDIGYKRVFELHKNILSLSLEDVNKVGAKLFAGDLTVKVKVSPEVISKN